MASRTPADEMRALHARLNAAVAAFREEEKTNTYWEGGYRQGVENALGGASGELAGSFTPEVAEALAGWLYRTARQWDHEVRGHLHDTCDGAIGQDCYCFVGALATVQAFAGTTS